MHWVPIFDHASQSELVTKYAAHPVDVKRIEVVDVVGTDLNVLRGQKFSFIVASHLVEHTPDLIAFLRDCGDLLSDDGVLYLIVPDKRYCFDHRRPISTTGQIVDAQLSGRSLHRGALFDQLGFAMARGGISAWGATASGAVAPIHKFQDAADALQQAIQGGAYVDAHEWVFVPSSFRLIIQDLGNLGLVPLFERDFHPSIGCEFYISLSKTRGHCPPSREALLDSAEDEVLADSYRLEGLIKDRLREALADRDTALAAVQKEVALALSPLRYVVADKANEKLRTVFGPLQGKIRRLVELALQVRR